MKEIKIDHITKNFKETVALNDISLTFEFGKIYGLLGRKGAGKSTLINIINNRIFADSGSVTIDGQGAIENDIAQDKIYCMSEKEMYPRSLKINKIFKLTNSFYDCFDYEKAIRYANAFELNLNRKVSTLATGNRSIFKLIIALSLDLPYIFLDEPVVGLDATQKELFYKLLIQESKDNQKTIVIATDAIEEVVNLIEEVILIDKGKVLMQTSVKQLKENGYCIFGLAGEIDEYCKEKNVIGVDTLEDQKIAYIIGDVDTFKGNEHVLVSPINLQQLFINLIKGEE